MVVTIIAIPPTEPLAKILLPIPTIWVLQMLVSRTGMLPPGETMIPLNCSLKLPASHFRVPMPLNQQAEKELLWWLK